MYPHARHRPGGGGGAVRVPSSISRMMSHRTPNHWIQMTKASSVYTHGHSLTVLPLSGMPVQPGWDLKNSVAAVRADTPSREFPCTTGRTRTEVTRTDRASGRKSGSTLDSVKTSTRQAPSGGQGSTPATRSSVAVQRSLVGYAISRIQRHGWYVRGKARSKAMPASVKTAQIQVPRRRDRGEGFTGHHTRTGQPGSAA